MDTRKGGNRYCPICKKNVETRVLLEGYCQEEIHGIPAKKRQIICGTDAEGRGGCGTKWFTLEILEDQIVHSLGRRDDLWEQRDSRDWFQKDDQESPKLARKILGLGSWDLICSTCSH